MFFIAKYIFVHSGDPARNLFHIHLSFAIGLRVCAFVFGFFMDIYFLLRTFLIGLRLVDRIPVINFNSFVF